ncbi:ATP-dependent metallopeptidase FtsH/Yme1/Tma family protein, partial [Enterobacter hormaechei]
FTLFQSPQQRQGSSDMPFTQFLSEVDGGRVRDVTIQGPEVTGHFTDGRTFQTYAPPYPGLTQKLFEKGVQVQARPPGEQVPWFVA